MIDVQKKENEMFNKEGAVNLVVYHGSKNAFDKFDYNRIGQNGTSEGIGFYFTDSYDIAHHYSKNGYLYTVEFNGQKPLSFESKTIKKNDLEKYLKKLDSANGYLSNYGDVDYRGINAVLKEAVNCEYENNNNDVDLICGICHASGDTETCLTLLYKTLGYDSIITEADWGAGSLSKHQILYIALTNDIIKIKKCVKTLD